ncbi:MAG: hypothetical protein AAFW84_00010 [Cyanobacteria bacterium J06635_15]
MSRPQILQEGQSYTFRSYCELPYELEDILAELGYGLKISELTLPSSDRPLPQLKTLNYNIRTILPLVSLSRVF